MEGKVSVETPGGSRTLKELAPDQLLKLYTPGPGPHARVGFTVGRSLGYGELKVSAHVSLECDQNEAVVNAAGETAFGKALELMNDGFAILTQEQGG
jgi:hypothetical protein